MGTIEVNNDNTATLKFSSEISNIIFGNNPQIGAMGDGQPKFKYYGNFSSGKTNVIRLNDPNATQTSITIILENEDVFYGTVRIGANPKIFYDFSNIESKQKQVDSKVMQDSLNKQLEITRIEEKLKYVMSQKIDYNDIGLFQDKMEVQVSNISNDDKNTYIKFIISNKSGSDYVIDNTIFKYVEGKKKGLKKKEAAIEEVIYPVYIPKQNTIKAYSYTQLGYVIPLFTVGSSGDFNIQFVEKNGTRNLKIEIPSNIMLNVKKIDF
jgi:hypothetical protein